MKYLLFCFVQFFFIFDLVGQIVIPSPAQIERDGREFAILDKQVTVFAADREASYLRLFQAKVLQSDIQLLFSDQEKQADIRFLKDTSLGKDAYKLSITPQGMEIRASESGGFVYAVQTLRQWVIIDQGHPVFTCVDISDGPRVQWRSFMLDSGRQFQQVSTIKKYIDMASLLKMNYFHWHLTEGLGWRIEIKKYPRLTQIGAFVGKGLQQQGFYTQKQIREVVAYAAERNITVVPEIDMPGHAEAALVAYPELGCFGTSVEVPASGFTKHIFCAGKTHTMSFLKNVLDEVCTLFPSEYIHLGGDEAPKGNWNECPDCQQCIRDEKLKDSHDLQLWFSAQMAEYIKQKGRKAIFWGDVVYQDGYALPNNVVIHWWNWRGHKELALNNAIKQGHHVICGTNYYTYLNFPLTPWKGYGADRTFDLRDVYLHNPSYQSNQEESLLLGMSCALWTDDGVIERMLDQRLFPRILALAEQMWHKGELSDFDTFYSRVQKKQTWFEQLGFTFGPALKDEVDANYKWD